MRLSHIPITAIVITLLALLYSNSLWQLINQKGNSNWFTILSDPYILHILYFSFWQAFISAILSILLGLITAHALFHNIFWGKKLLIKLFSLSVVLPVLVAIFGILGVYGKSGWISQLLTWSNIDIKLNIYGITGILIAHVFFNLPLSAKIFLNTLNIIPNQHKQLASQLGVINWNFIRLIEWPYIRQQILSVFVLVFMLCFTSFTIVLILGGGPKYTTLEVAIFQAITFDFELQKASILALMQFIFCSILFVISSHLSTNTPTAANIGKKYIIKLPTAIKVFHKLIILSVVIFIFLPLVNIILSSLNINAWIKSLTNPTLYKAIIFSLIIAIFSGILSISLAIGIILGTRQLYFIGKINIAKQLTNIGMIILAIPTLVLSVSLFLLLRNFNNNILILFIIVIICNSLMAMPFSIRILMQPMYDNMILYERLCSSLGIKKFSRLYIIEWHNLKQPIQSAFALASTLSLGDFTAIALFGNDSFTSLPRLLYQQLGNYRSSEASVTAFILLFLCILIFIIIERYDNKNP